MKILVFKLALILALLPSFIFSQQSSTIPHISLFVPLYLDSVFDKDTNYRPDKEFPKYINSGLEFYEGFQRALDSIAAEGISLDVQVYDTRSSTGNVREMLRSETFDKNSLVLGHTTALETKMLAEACKKRNIPFINVNYPNDAGINANPEFTLLNTTLKAHCEGIYRFLQKNYPTKQIIYIRKKGAVEDRLNNYFSDAAKYTSSVPLKMKVLNIEKDDAIKELEQNLDSNRQNVVICGSMDDKFARELCTSLSTLSKSYRTTVVGMPTWDNLADFSDPEYEGIEIIYSTPFYINPDNALIKRMQDDFKSKFYSRPSDMFFRGYQAAWHFAKLASQFGAQAAAHINDKKNNAWGEYDIQPVYLDRTKMTIDYYENRKLYFIKKTNGNITAVL